MDIIRKIKIKAYSPTTENFAHVYMLFVKKWRFAIFAQRLVCRKMRIPVFCHIALMYSFSSVYKFAGSRGCKSVSYEDAISYSSTPDATSTG